MKVHCVRGNHGRSLSEDTEILTENGWKTYKTINKNDIIATYNIEKDKVEWQLIQDINIYNYSGKMFHGKHKSLDFKVTPEHNMVEYDRKNSIHTLRKVEEIWDKKDNVIFSLSAKSYNLDYPISDDWLRLFGWLLTDANYFKSKDKNFIDTNIYQSKLEYINEIENLLTILNIPFSEHHRQRDIKEICGKVLKNKPKEGYSFRILASNEKDNILKLLQDRKIIPHWMYNLSDRQVSILLETITKADGTLRKAGRGRSDGYASKQEEIGIYKNKEFLDQLQALLVTHDIPSNIRKDNRGGYVLSIRNSKNVWLTKNNKQLVNYNGIAWCVTVPNHTIFTRRNGKVLIVGNSGRFSDETSNWDIALYEACRIAT
ncbi:MAG: LAGLIDADG family homing endonuclease, partial [Nanoarchaeota archaeon]